MKFTKLNTQLVAIVLLVELLSACGGGNTSADAPIETPSSTATTAATPSTASSTFGGTYTGVAGRVVTPFVYDGPLSITLNRDVTGNYTVSGNWNVTKRNSDGPIATVNDLISGSVTSAGVLTATGNINVRSITGTVDSATGKITGSYTYAGTAGDFTGNFSVTK